MLKTHIINLQLFGDSSPQLTLDEAMLKITELSSKLQHNEDTIQAKDIELQTFTTQTEKLSAEITRIQASNLRLFNMVEEQTLGQLSNAPKPQEIKPTEEQAPNLDDIVNAFL